MTMSTEERIVGRDGADVEMTDANETATTGTSVNKAKRKKPAKHTTLTQFTIRNPTWAYIHLRLVLSHKSTPSTLDALTAQLHLQSALSSFLGLHGTAIPLDFLKIEGQDVWLRLPREDASAVVAAVGGWMGKNGEGWQVKNWGSWGPDLSSRSGMDLFDD